MIRPICNLSELSVGASAADYAGEMLGAQCEPRPRGCVDQSITAMITPGRFLGTAAAGLQSPCGEITTPPSAAKKQQSSRPCLRTAKIQGDEGNHLGLDPRCEAVGGPVKRACFDSSLLVS